MKTLTLFQKKVYTVVKNIPRGETRSYAWVGRKAGRPGTARAVGTALKKNPYTIIVPCHRVIRSNGSLGEYALGADLKRRLLEIERAESLKKKPQRIQRQNIVLFLNHCCPN